MKRTEHSERARRAEERASRHHQGSGVHADICVGIALLHEAEAERQEGLGVPIEAACHYHAAKLWADAAEAEAAHLEEVQGRWSSMREWRKSKSGQAAKAAAKVSRKLGVDPAILQEAGWYGR